MPIQTTITDTPVPVKIWTDEIEPDAARQLRNTASLPFVFHHVAAMPDVHLGKGATVGSVVATRGAICPAAVGVDIGCGMIAQKTMLRADDLTNSFLQKLRSAIEHSVPVGFNAHSSPTPVAREFMADAGQPTVIDRSHLSKAAVQLGTLGGGNHFIEVCIDHSDDYVWLLLHSGSRNVGKTVAEVHINKAKGLIKKMAERLPDPDLAYFVERTPEFDKYIRDLEWCQNYARVNREIMMDTVIRELSCALGRGGDTRGLLAP